MSKMNKATLVALLEEAGYEPQSYSGRGMYGKTCVGVAVNRGDFEFLLGVKLCRAALEMVECYDTDQPEHPLDAAVDLLYEIEDLKVCTDTLGLGTIVYFPNVHWNND